jgi:hypothetical protein
MTLRSYARALGLYDSVEPIHSALVRYRWVRQGGQHRDNSGTCGAQRLRALHNDRHHGIDARPAKAK